jgi:hypothetical protein
MAKKMARIKDMDITIGPVRSAGSMAIAEITWEEVYERPSVYLLSACSYDSRSNLRVSRTCVYVV